MRRSSTHNVAVDFRSPSRFFASRTWWHWVLAVTLGELIGFGGLAALGGVLTLHALRDVEPAARALPLYAVSILGGVAEGAVLAAFQWIVLRRIYPAVSKTRWIRNTAIAGGLAWALGMLAPTLDDWVGLASVGQVAIGVFAGIAILPSIGLAQAWAFRGAVARPYRWVAANVSAWLLGLPWTFVLPALLRDDAPLWAFGLCFLIAGVLMGLTVGAVTGLWLPSLNAPRGQAR